MINLYLWEEALNTSIPAQYGEYILQQAQAAFLSYCNREDIPAAANTVIEQMAMIIYNRTGTEGLTNQSYSGSNEGYQSDYPEYIRAQLNRYRKVKLL